MKLDTIWEYQFLDSELNQTITFDCHEIKKFSDKFLNPFCQKIEGLLKSNRSTISGWVRNAYVHFLGKTCLFTEELLVESACKPILPDCGMQNLNRLDDTITPQWHIKSEIKNLTRKYLWNITRKAFTFQANKMVVNIVTDVEINIMDFDIVPDKSDVNFYLNFEFLKPNVPEIHLEQTTLNRIYLLVNDVSFLAEDCLFNQAGIIAQSDTKQNNQSLIFRRCTFTGYMYNSFIQTVNISATLELCIFLNLNDAISDPFPYPWDFYSKFFYCSALKCFDSELKVLNSSIKNSVIKLGRHLLVMHFCNITFSHLRVSNNSYKDHYYLLPNWEFTYNSFFTTHDSSITIRDSWFSQNNIKDIILQA